MDVNREIRLAVNTGKTLLGVDQSKKAVEDGNAKLLIVAKNCPEKNFLKEEYNGVPIYQFEGTNKNLGSAAGKPFAVSVLTVIEQGESNVLSLKS